MQRLMRTWVWASLASLAGLFSQVQPLVAQDKLALVIGNGAYAETPLAKATSNSISVSRSLLGLGYDVTRLIDVNAEDHPIKARTADTVVLYFSGRTADVDGDTMLLSVDQNIDGAPVGWALSELVSAYQQAGAARVLVFLDSCHAELASEETLLPTPPEMVDVFLAQAGAPDAACLPKDETTPSFTDALLAGLLIPNVPLAEAFEADQAVWSTSTLTQPYIFRQADEQIKGLAAEDLKMLDQLTDDERDRMLALWRRAGIIEGNAGAAAPAPVALVQNETIVLSTPIQPVSMAATVVSMPNVARAGNVPVVQGGVQIFTAVATPARLSRPTAAGLPTPSIIVGDIRPTNASFNPTDVGGALTGTEVGGIGFEARRKMRAEDPEQFEQLLINGAFDPLPEALPRAIQSELARMGCYTTRVDGIWGNGSRAAVDRYFVQVGVQPNTREPQTELFRQLVRKDDVVCPVAQATTARATTPQGSTRTRTNTAPRRTTAPATTGPRKVNRSINAAGVFR